MRRGNYARTKYVRIYRKDANPFSSVDPKSKQITSPGTWGSHILRPRATLESLTKANAQKSCKCMWVQRFQNELK